jgi:hypothetical protein
MTRALLLVGGSILIAAALGYTLLFTGGRSHGAAFSIGSLHVEYEATATGTLGPERLDYAIVSKDEPQAEQVHSTASAPHRVTRTYIDAGKTNTLMFSINPGQTAWIGTNRTVSFALAPLRLNDLELLKQHAGDKLLPDISSLEDLRNALSVLRGTQSDRNGYPENVRNTAKGTPE